MDLTVKAMTESERLRRQKLAAKRLYYERKSWGLCVYCGKPVDSEDWAVSCSKCIQKHKERYEANKERMREKHRQFRDSHIAAGLCTYCNKEAVEGSTKCAYHKAYYRNLSREAYLKRLERNNEKQI